MGRPIMDGSYAERSLIFAILVRFKFSSAAKASGSRVVLERQHLSNGYRLVVQRRPCPFSPWMETNVLGPVAFAIAIAALQPSLFQNGHPAESQRTSTPYGKVRRRTGCRAVVRNGDRCQFSAEELDNYSVRSASIGFTRVARRAGTKQEAAATRVRRPATTR